MKLTALFFALLVAGIAADPVTFVDSPKSVSDARDQRESILVTIIRSLLQTVADFLANYDPVARNNYYVGTTIVEAVDVGFGFDSLAVEGFSKFVANNIDYVNNILIIDLEFQQLSFSIKNMNAYIGPVDLKGDITLDILGTGLKIEAGLELGSLTLTSLDLTPRVGSASSDVTVFFIGDDVSDFVNDYVTRLGDLIVRLTPRIAEIIEIILIGILS